MPEASLRTFLRGLELRVGLCHFAERILDSDPKWHPLFAFVEVSSSDAVHEDRQVSLYIRIRVL